MNNQEGILSSKIKLATSWGSKETEHELHHHAFCPPSPSVTSDIWEMYPGATQMTQSSSYIPTEEKASF